MGRRRLPMSARTRASSALAFRRRPPYHLRAETLKFATGSLVSSWTDPDSKTTVSQSQSLFSPILRLNAINGRPALLFKTKQQLIGPSPFGKTTTITVMAVVKTGPKFDTVFRAIFALWQGGEKWWFGAVTRKFVAFTANNSYKAMDSAAFTLDAAYVVTFTSSFKSGAHVYKNGKQVGSTTFVIPAPSGPKDFGIGGKANGSSDSWDGHIAEVVAWSTVLSTSQRQVAEACLMKKYGL